MFNQPKENRMQLDQRYIVWVTGLSVEMIEALDLVTVADVAKYIGQMTEALTDAALEAAENQVRAVQGLPTNTPILDVA